jgi:hypothetical protein
MNAVCSQLYLFVETIISCRLHSTFLVLSVASEIASTVVAWLVWLLVSFLVLSLRLHHFPISERFLLRSADKFNHKTFPPLRRFARSFQGSHASFFEYQLHELEAYSGCCTSISGASVFHLDTLREAHMISSKAISRQFSNKARSALLLKLLVA